MAKKFFFLFVFCFLLEGSALAMVDRKDIPCIRGYCSGWEVRYERESGNDMATVIIKNLTGMTSFKLQATIHCYDFFRNHLGSIPIDSRRPLYNNQWLKEKVLFPPQTHTIQCDIYWSDTDQSD